MQYQVVIQFQEKLYADIEWISVIEEQLDALLIAAEIDGHDLGAGEINLFVHTNDPVGILDTVKDVLIDNNFELENIKIAYREINGGQYIPLWPEDLVDFQVT